MAATKARSVFVVSFAAGLLASAAVLVSSEGAAQPQPYFGLPNVDLVDEPPRPSEVATQSLDRH